MLRAEPIDEPADAELPMKIVILDNKKFKGDYDLAKEIPIEILDSEKTTNGNL